MKIYGLVGPSGTGKSYKASNLAYERGILYIIDDGLFIKGSKVIAGISAKKEATMVAAVRRALFMDKKHATSVKEAIEITRPNAILILGTSVNMIHRIVSNLGLPPAEEIIKIKDVSTEEEIQAARISRREQGMHVIPVPTLEIRKDFSGYLLHPLRILRFTERGKKIETLEKTVMRPTYSYMGKFYIADLALESIASYNACKIEGVYRVTKVTSTSHAGGVVINMEITVAYGCKIHEIVNKIQDDISKDIVHLTGINVLQVNVTVRSIVIEKAKTYH
ncbi:MAG TPA: Asp23/Gls24 family envelope stress response protein [Clostridiales bacterium]|nr:Asp23/Gls24 family envelope stress response protein [Clostridiales bacterium]